MSGIDHHRSEKEKKRGGNQPEFSVVNNNTRQEHTRHTRHTRPQPDPPLTIVAIILSTR
jgi:hypothetical protein